MPQVQVLSPRPFFIKDVSAGVAQLVVQLICNQQVGGSSPSTGSKKADAAFAVSAFFVLAAKEPGTSLSEVQFVSVNRLQKSRCRFRGVL